jgi:uncharacterized protein YeaO (DUF488 family)
MAIVVIVPAKVTDGYATRTNGTQVLVDGVPLSGVTKIELTADVDDVWRAKIHCLVKVGKISAGVDCILGDANESKVL